MPAVNMDWKPADEYEPRDGETVLVTSENASRTSWLWEVAEYSAGSPGSREEPPSRSRYLDVEGREINPLYWARVPDPYPLKGG